MPVHRDKTYATLAAGFRKVFARSTGGSRRGFHVWYVGYDFVMTGRQRSTVNSGGPFQDGPVLVLVQRNDSAGAVSRVDDINGCTRDALADGRIAE